MTLGNEVPEYSFSTASMLTNQARLLPTLCLSIPATVVSCERGRVLINSSNVMRPNGLRMLLAAQRGHRRKSVGDGFGRSPPQHNPALQPQGSPLDSRQNKAKSG